ncbi:MAG: sn-glycerol-3-phosphate ABC transporter ATP-binding protein UgpC [Verrucomicrobiaceae bacterium]|nr:MAG: sn-glycerol-3-phosphate ABC transporter ATP-binding protein UgpC [Verrucomicrobiaceae bacterium]
MSQVAFNNVYKIFPGEKGGDITAVRDFTLEISPREFLVLVGPSGCGKSTTLRMVAGLEEVTRGDIFIGGRRVNDIPPKDRDIAMVFQNYALYPHMSVFENLAFGLKLRKLPKAEIKKRVNDVAEILGLQQLLDRKPKALSGGQCQRVALGRAIVRQPKVFLFDEPLSNLDARLRTQMRSEIVKLHQRLQATILYVTHDQVEAMTMGTRIVVMDAALNLETGRKEGVIQQIDTPMNLYREPANMFVAGFLGSPPMNFIKGTLRKDGEQLCFKEAQGGAIEVRLGSRPAAEALLGREVVMGIRPEHCIPIPSGKPSAGSFQAVVDLVEPMGAETYFHLQTGAHTLISRTPGGYGQEDAGHRQRFEISAGEAHLFDPATTLRIH